MHKSFFAEQGAGLEVMNTSIIYNAFISYSHAADGQLAPALQKALQRFAKPLFSLRALHIFRDNTNLNLSPDLWSTITRALDRSEYFVFLASPTAAQSKWVAREIEYWLANKDPAKILIVVTDGDFVWDANLNAINSSMTNCIPDALARSFDGEPLYLDLRWARTEVELTLDNARFKEAIAQLSATVKDQPLQDVLGDEVAQLRRTRGLRNIAVSLITVFGVAAITAAWIALNQRDVALAERDRAIIRRMQNDSLRIANQPGMLNGLFDYALLLAIQSYRLEPNLRSWGVLLTIMQKHTREPAVLRDVQRFSAPGHGGASTAAGTVLGPGGRFLPIVSSHFDGSSVAILDLGETSTDEIEFDRDSWRGLVSCRTGDYSERSDVIRAMWFADDKGTLKVIHSPETYPGEAIVGGPFYCRSTITSDANVIVESEQQLVTGMHDASSIGRWGEDFDDVDIAYRNNQTIIATLIKGEVSITYRDDYQQLIDNLTGISDVALNYNGSHIAYRTNSGKVEIRELKPSADILHSVDVESEPRDIALSSNASLLAIALGGSQIRIHNLHTDHTFLLNTGLVSVEGIIFANNTTLVVGGTNSVLETIIAKYDTNSSHVISPPVPTSTHTERITKPISEVNDYGQEVYMYLEPGWNFGYVIDHQKGTVSIRDSDTWQVIAPEIKPFGPVSVVDFSPDNSIILTWSSISDEGFHWGGEIVLWDRKSGTALGNPFAVSGLEVSSQHGEDIRILWDEEDSIWGGRLAAKACEVAGRNLTLSEWDDYLSHLDYEKTCPK